MTEHPDSLPVDPAALRAADHIYRAWDAALVAKDIDAALMLYAEDATLESPLAGQLIGLAEGVLRGRQAIRAFVEKVFATLPAQRQNYRIKYFTDGRTLMWEYPRETPTKPQMEFVEVMELKNGLIQRHRVYWGWFGLSLKSGVVNRDAA
jgi:ketosteroid isomerase-like protein